ncbi:MAG: hypothetical protein N2234_04740 [Planctomycetota bacterium]|nr:hypothetical protein [Planctomycetota bacterium]
MDKEGLPGLELPLEEAERIIANVARRIVDWGMSVPAVIALEVVKPVSFIAGNLLLTIAPFLYPLFGKENIESLCGFLNNRAFIELLAKRIEELSEEGEKKAEVKKEG